MTKKRFDPEQDPSSIGNILVDLGFLDVTKLEELVEGFRRSKDELLGEYIVRHTTLTSEQIEVALLRQQRMRGKASEAMVVRLMEISKNSHKQVVEGFENLTVAIKATSLK